MADVVKRTETPAETPEKRAEEERIVRSAPRELAAKAMAETVTLAGKLGGGIKALWSKIHVDRSPEAMLASLNGSLDENRKRREDLGKELEALYNQIAAKKKLYMSAAPVRQRLLKTELQTLLAQYKSLEREFNLLCENERSITTVKGRFMEVLIHGLRGKLDVDMIDRLSDTVEGKTDEAEDVQDALGDLDRAGRRHERGDKDFDAELAGFEEAPADADKTPESTPDQASETASPEAESVRTEPPDGAV